MNAHGGRRVGAGRKPADLSRAVRQLIDATLPSDEIADILRALAALAKSGKPGSVQAASLLLALAFGPPGQSQGGDEDLPPIQIIRIHDGPQPGTTESSPSADTGTKGP